MKRNTNDINLTFFQGVVTSEMSCWLFIQGFCQEPGSWPSARLEPPANRLLHSLSLNANACGPRPQALAFRLRLCNSLHRQGKAEVVIGGRHKCYGNKVIFGFMREHCMTGMTGVIYQETIVRRIMISP